VWKSKRIQGQYREFNEEPEADFIKMRMIAVLEAEETVERGLSERDHPSTCFA
jgi:hypothetical protein